ncbi:MAG: gamma carbonic anhydrase family protein [Nitrososphaerales archaeon]|uniref:Putative Carbonic anhydrases/acetyltransferases, isoleucine patch superfamily n=1 Tax=uncultured marine thaumarchaeote KM3_53_E01 TaxID=1456183 RepID=A0A075H5U6_9ARCH|nr:putative Carbonic anhydrases/acetyltransferases, isoleucine patch superfamily [uncultured marine thaumarchaeote KM3_53_E01]MCH2379941.1 gamma carbonic anhydrase family protein [Nitrososphaerales archaeon]|tara:strand:+ start:73 stop:579 length:507 start_codon:yes stop_codon:yes gene_type:complete
MITGFNGITPQIPSSTYVAHSADVIGNVVLGNDVSVWHNSVIRGDFNSIVVEDSSNIQDNSVLHVDSNEPLHIGTNTTIGHGCIIHGCTIGNSCLIGMGSLIMNRAMIGSNCIIGAGTLITQDTKIPDNSIVLGRPGKISKQISQSDLEYINSNAKAYVALKNKYLNQ